MSYRVISTARADRDVDECFNFIASRSSRGAASWFNAYENALRSLEHAPSHGIAAESRFFGGPIREHVFKTRYGLPYRILFVVRGDIVYVIHVRGPGQDMLSASEVQLPPIEEP